MGRAHGGAAAVATLAALAIGSAPAAAQVFLTQEEALRLAFPPPAQVERRTAFLTEDQLARARNLAGRESAPRQAVVTYYVAFEGTRPLGVAYFDAHRVRTLEEVLMVVVTPVGTIASIEVLRFSEPPEYRAPSGWLGQFPGRSLDDRLSVRGGIAGITGATLTSRAVTGAARRALALHSVIAPFDSIGDAGRSREGGTTP
jgi:Na+-translocating ferredoxin:NAD+ oxidoreductase RnfG subunit